jgi:Leucine-rich repeat (LRR) protein
MSDPFFYGCWPVHPPRSSRVVEVAYYKGGPSLLLECTQLPGKASRQTKVVQEWCDFFQTPSNLREIYVSTRIPERLFEAICQQTQLEQFGFSWGPIKDLSPIAKLKKLKRLGIGSTSVVDLAPLAKLTSLEMLSVVNADRLSDYTPLGKLSRLEYLHIEGNFHGRKRAPIDDVKFLSKLKNLKGLSLDFVKIAAANWHKPIMKLTSLDELFVPELDEAAKDELISALPNLKKYEFK